MSRDTRTGDVLETMVLPALRRGGYHYRRRVDIGKRLNVTRHHYVDAVAWSDSKALHLISSKWQQSSGTAEQKVPFEAMCLGYAVMTGSILPASVLCMDCGESLAIPEKPILRAHIVLGGEGWTLRTFYTQGGLADLLPISKFANILTLEAFVAKANTASL